VLQKAGSLLTVVAVALLLACGGAAAVGVELPTRPTIAGTPAVRPAPAEPLVEAEAPVPAQPLPDPAPPTTALAAPAPATTAQAPPVQSSPDGSGGTVVSFTISPR